MNPETNKFESLRELSPEELEDFKLKKKQFAHTLTSATLVRPDGSPVPNAWSVFELGELVVIKNYTFKVAHIGEQHILFEPVSPVLDKLSTDGRTG